ncbi:trp operon repressor [bacterium]|nr:trp operon repressor [bacterium]
MDKNKLKKLSKIILSVKGPKTMEAFLADLLTPAEIEDLDLRVRIVKSLLKEKPQRQVSTEEQASISKVSRGAATLKYGNGGFEKVLG